MLIIGFMSGSFLGQQMQFLELMPQFKCSLTNDFAVTYDCVPLTKKNSDLPTFCDKNLTVFYDIDYSNPLSIHNWIVDLKPSLICK